MAALFQSPSKYTESFEPIKKTISFMERFRGMKWLILTQVTEQSKGWYSHVNVILCVL